MTHLKVVGDDGFRQDVETALDEICPCSMISVDGGTAVSGDQEWSVIGTAPPDCACYCKHRIACNLLQDVIGNDQVTWIRSSKGGNGYDWDSHTVYWNLEAPKLPSEYYEGATGYTDDSSLRLAHELVHALRDGNDPAAGYGDPEEFIAVRGTNQIRKEMGHPLRTHYTTDKAVLGYDVGISDMDPWDRQGCSCGCKDWLDTLLNWIVLVFRRLMRRL
jgi:hypothetical protein